MIFDEQTNRFCGLTVRASEQFQQAMAVWQIENPQPVREQFVTVRAYVAGLREWQARKEAAKQVILQPLRHCLRPVVGMRLP